MMSAKIFLTSGMLFLFGFIAQAAKAPDFTVTDYNNKVHKLYQDYLNKDKVMVIKFFFIGCPPCASVAPYVQSAYERWGSGSGKVEFLQISTMRGDFNSGVKSYSQGKGLTFPGVGFDGGAQAVLSPYSSGTFGPWYGTPTFVVIAPDGEVNYNVPMSAGNPSALDTAIARALRSGSGGGGGCSNAFSVKTVTSLQPETYYVIDYLNGNPAKEIKTGVYNCEFTLPQNIDGHYVVPQMNRSEPAANGVTTADIVFMQRHILHLDTMNNLQQLVSDVNNSSTITAADVSEVRKLVLGVTDRFSKLAKSFVVVHNPASRSGLISERVLIKDLIAKSTTNEFGVGKYGDVNGAKLFAGEEIQNRSAKSVDFQVERISRPDGLFEHRFYLDPNERLSSFQLALSGDVAGIAQVVPGPAWNANTSFDYHLNVRRTSLRIL
ncbi:MAG TPA: redoxin domain-containing protein, partial [Saprospiraceae bacterium]|nr:redoxin domain-containing protein [Saprospiraceae bacterium]